MNRSDALNKRMSAFRHRQTIEKKELEGDIRKKAELCRRFLADKRHKEYKEFWEGQVTGLRLQRDILSSSVKDNDEYLRKALILDAQITAIRWMLETPEKFIKYDTNMNSTANTRSQL